MFDSDSKVLRASLILCIAATFYPESYLLRSSLAGGIGFFAVMQILASHYVRALLLIMVSGAFHIAGFVLIPLLFVKFLARSASLKALILIILTILLVFPSSLGITFLTVIGNFTGHGYLQAKVALYSSAEYQRSIGVAPIVVAYLLATSLSLAVTTTLKVRNYRIEILQVIAIYGLSVLILFWDVPALGERSARLIIPIFFMLFSETAQLFSRNVANLFSGICLICANIYIYLAVPESVFVQ